ncbi:uncharacterized protein A1O5_11669 [Cladophialophora psammophila CBS 110553]|uniref:DNA polymerase delta subunit 3 n=1 Tax=Cladophialophora psammophila CBS 110553 TaxID=1182543 RepID=W9W5Y3_9EURO|nr:uncharacterized protein A1O5_11669 [Cladophialophora psammophila CBS 110553]EXJ63348.1 hypothetical protein A1O5_11669 [Cladophialophora psammophila CBS 110553]
MAEDFKKYLASEVLNEQRTVSYRTLSRALKVHVNAAKCMLYEFYDFQNTKKPRSVYATYLLSGIKKTPTLAVVTNGTARRHAPDEDPDEHIPSSPPPFTSSMLEPSQQSSHVEEEEVKQQPVRTITLVREETLEAVKEEYETITSIHIYSLSPARIQDLVTLTDISQSLFTDGIATEHSKTYGLIQNPDVRRRKGKRPVILRGPASKSQPIKEENKKTLFSNAKPTPKGSTAAPPVKSEEPSRPSSRDSTSTSISNKQPTLRRDASDLFKAFAKHGRPKSTPAATPKSSSQDPDTTMNDVDEGESEDEALFLDTGTRKSATSKKRSSDLKKEREDKAAKLRKMMESDDEEEAAAPSVEETTGIENDEPPAAKKGTDADTEAKDDEGDDQVAWSDSDTEKKQASKEEKSEQHDAATAPPRRRRRGKRKVMRKRTTKEDGYLVTREEAVWESFSEDEPEPPPRAAKKEAPKSSAPKTHSQGSSSSQAQNHAGKAGPGGKKKGPGGRGNIMSFFGKKNA